MGMTKTVILTGVLSIILFLYLQNHFTNQIALTDALISFVLSVTFAKIIETIQRYYHSTQLLNTTNLGQAALFAGINSIFIHVVCSNVFKPQPDYLTFLNDSALFRFIFVAMAFMLLLAFFWADQQKIHLKKLSDFALDVERENMAIELKHLQEQLKPHFLFNSLNSISALSTSNPDEARRMILMLSQFLRNTIGSDDKLVVFEEEIKNVELYSSIEEVRFGDRLKIDFDIQKEAYDWVVPHLILQPLIENAIKYGLYDAIDAVTIRFEATIENDQLHVQILNPYDEETSKGRKGTGYGLESVRKKLQLIYKSSNLIETNAANGTFTVHLKIPRK